MELIRNEILTHLCKRQMALKELTERLKDYDAYAERVILELLGRVPNTKLSAVLMMERTLHLLLITGFGDVRLYFTGPNRIGESDEINIMLSELAEAWRGQVQLDVYAEINRDHIAVRLMPG